MSKVIEGHNAQATTAYGGAATLFDRPQWGRQSNDRFTGFLGQNRTVGKRPLSRRSETPIQKAASMRISDIQSDLKLFSGNLTSVDAWTAALCLDIARCGKLRRFLKTIMRMALGRPTVIGSPR